MLDDIWDLPWELRFALGCVCVAFALIALAALGQLLVARRAGRHHSKDVAPEHKPAGQGRLTRMSRTGMDVQDNLTDPPLAQQEPPPLRSDDPPLAADGHPQTSTMPAVLPPLPPIRPRTGPASAAAHHQPPLRETRAERRRRLEALIDAEAEARNRPPQSPHKLREDG